MEFDGSGGDFGGSILLALCGVTRALGGEWRLAVGVGDGADVGGLAVGAGGNVGGECVDFGSGGLAADAWGESEGGGIGAGDDCGICDGVGGARVDFRLV